MAACWPAEPMTAVISPRLRLDGKVALVTGCGAGIGRALAVGLAAAGADIAAGEIAGQLFLADRNVAAVRELGRDALSVELDGTDVEGITRGVGTVPRHFGHIDVLVHSA